ncbi:MAG: cupin domain-containing protein [Gammaproteobacteria bacterium]|nr:cupin domain-containing protein [Gammaproteobacteria bacterium]
MMSGFRIFSRASIGGLVVSLPVALSACGTTAALPDPLAAGWLEKPVCERLHESKRQRILRCSFPPGVGHERHFHAPHFGYTLKGGLMRITDSGGAREVEIDEGVSFSSDGIDWHEVLNIGDTSAQFLIIEAKE